MIQDSFSKFLFVFLFISKSAFPQQTAIYTDPERDFKTGTELFEKEKYSAAAGEFEKYIAKTEAMKREKQIKNWKSRKLLENLINSTTSEHPDL